MKKSLKYRYLRLKRLLASLKRILNTLCKGRKFKTYKTESHIYISLRDLINMRSTNTSTAVRYSGKGNVQDPLIYRLTQSSTNLICAKGIKKIVY